MGQRALHCQKIEFNICIGDSGQADKSETTFGSSIQEDGSTGAFAKSKLGRIEGKCLSKHFAKSKFCCLALSKVVGSVAEICSSYQ